MGVTGEVQTPRPHVLTYADWAVTLCRYFFREENAGRPITLFVDDELLRDLSGAADPSEAAASFEAALQSNLQAGGDPFGRIFQQAETWKRRKADSCSSRQGRLLSPRIGRAIALELAERGYDLIVTARRQDLLEALAGEVRTRFNRRVEVITADIGSRQGCQQVEAVIAAGLDILVANAGFSTRGSFPRLPLEREVAEVELNVLSRDALEWLRA
ncbi:MAG TPA: SDR family NAD(P)-dependent oxidoreductase [Candidatus Dormibacteraeota bacterium]